MAKPLEALEEVRASLLARCGLSAAAARAYVAMERGGGWLAADLATATGLTRQDAAKGARELELAQLARVESVATGGRPALRYHAMREGLVALIAKRRAQIAEELAALEALGHR